MVTQWQVHVSLAHDQPVGALGAFQLVGSDVGVAYQLDVKGAEEDVARRVDDLVHQEAEW